MKFDELDNLAKEALNNASYGSKEPKSKTAYFYGFKDGYKKCESMQPQWHDLTKDPSDLPPIEGFRSDFVLVKLINSTLPFSVDRRSFDGSWFYNFSDKVVAWREIDVKGGKK